MCNAEKFVPRYTAEDYQKWDGDWELWDGYAVAMSPSPFGKHNKTASEMCRLFGNAMKANLANPSVANIYSGLDWIATESTVVRPDISISCGDVFEKHITAPPAIVIEILSENTSDHDLKFKRGLYESQAVSYYIILDPVEKKFTQLGLEGDVYKDVTQGQFATFTICENCTLGSLARRGIQLAIVRFGLNGFCPQLLEICTSHLNVFSESRTSQPLKGM